MVSRPWTDPVGCLTRPVLSPQKNICTLDEAKKRRNEIINIAAASLIAAVLGYLFFLYVIVHYAGAWLSIWE
jgi:hypothetical protein